MANCNECWLEGPVRSIGDTVKVHLLPWAEISMLESNDLESRGEPRFGTEQQQAVAAGIVNLEKDCNAIGEACELTNPNDFTSCPKIIRIFQMTGEPKPNSETQ